MAGNQYYTPAQFNYEPLDYSGLIQAGLNKQKKYDDTRADLNKSMLDANIKSIHYHDEPRNKFVENFNNQAAELVNSGIDFGSRAGRQKVTNLINTYRSNPDLQIYSRSVDAYKKQLDDIEALKKDPEKYAYYNDPTLMDEKLYQMGANPYQDKESGRAKEYTYRPVQSASSHTKPVYELFDKIKDSGNIQSYAEFAGDKSYIQSGKHGWEGVSPQTIKTIADNNIDTFKETPGGQDFIRKFRFDNAESLMQLPPEKRQQAEQEAISNHMYSLGSAYIRMKKSSDKDLKTTSAFDQKVKEEADKMQFTTETGATETNKDWTKSLGLQDNYNADGSPKVSNSSFNFVAKLTNGKEFTIKNADDYMKYEDYLNKNSNIGVYSQTPIRDTKWEEDIIKAQHALYEKANKLGLNILKPNGSVDGEATKQAVINYGNNIATFSNYTIPIQNPSIVNTLTEDMFGKISNIHNMQIYEQGDKDTKAKYEDKKAKEGFKGSKVTGLDYTADKPGALTFVAPEGEYGDKPFVAISRNKTLQDAMAPVQSLTIKTLNGAKTGDRDPSAAKLTQHLAGETVKDSFGHTVTIGQLGIPVGSSRDTDGSLLVSYLDNSTGTPIIQVLKKKLGKPTEVMSLEELQQQRTGEIFNTGGPLSSYQKQGTKQVLPTTNYTDSNQ